MAARNQDCNAVALTWVFPVLGICLAVALSWGLGWLQGRERELRSQTPNSYAAAAKRDVERSCLGNDPRVVFECVNAKVENAYETAHDEQDLSAQQRAAFSALISSIFGFFSLILSVIGVWYVKRTLDATLQAVNDTSDATKAMLRQNEISFEKERGHLKSLYCEAHQFQPGNIVSVIKFENIGASLCEIYGFSFEFTDSAMFPLHLSEPSEGLQIKIAPGTLGDLGASSTSPVCVPVFLHGIVVYKTAGSTNHRSHFSFYLVSGAGNDGKNLIAALASLNMPNDT